MFFHTFSPPQVRYVLLLIKIPLRHMPDSYVWEELEALDIRVQEARLLRSGRRVYYTTKNRPPAPPYVVSLARGQSSRKFDSYLNSAA